MAPLSLKVIQDAGAVVTRTVKVDSKDTAEAVLDVVREKFMIADDGKEYGLFLTAADDDLSGVWLEPRRAMEYYMLRDGDELLLLSRTRTLRLRMLDGSVKTLQVDESQPISQLLAAVCARIGITNHEEYGLCYDEDESGIEPKPATGTLTLRRAPQQPRERDAKLEHMSKKLKTDDNVQWLDMHRTLREQRVGPRATLLLQRRLYYTDRNVDGRDPVQLNLLYVQTRDDILDGRHPVTVDQACEFAGIQCQIQYGDYQEEKRKTYLDDYKKLLPSNVSTRSGLEKKIIKEYMKHQGLSALDAKHLYTKTARELPTYGVTFFVVKEKQQKGKKKLVPRLLGISADAILRLDEETKEILQSWPLTQVLSYQVGKAHTFTLNFGDYSDKEYSVKTNDAVRIRDILQGYIDIIAKRLAGARNDTMNDGQVVVEDNVYAARANIVQHVQNNPSKIVEESFVGPTKISYEPGQTASQGTQLVSVQQILLSQQLAGQRCVITGEVPHRKGMSLEFVRKLNKMNSNSVKVVNLITSEEGPHTAELTSIVSTMENDLPLIASGVNEVVKTDMDEDAKKRLLKELQELTTFLSTLSQQVQGSNPGSDEALEAASKIADVSTQMYLGLDPLTKRRSNLIRISRQSFIEDDKVDASLRRASFLAAADCARAAVDKAKATANGAYEGPVPTPTEVETLERAARDNMRKLNGAVALFLTAHADVENIDYSAAVTSMNTINELIVELAKDAQALASSKDEASKQELIDDINQLCSATKLVCSLVGCDDHQKLQDVTSAYGPAADKLIFTFGRGRRDDKDNRIIELAKDVGEKTSVLLMKANELMELLPAQAERLDEAGVLCAAAAGDLLACAMLTSPCIHEPHCQSALTASAETLASSAQRLMVVAKPLLEDDALKNHGDELKARSMALAKALDALKNAYEHKKSVEEETQRLQFVKYVAAARAGLLAIQGELDKPFSGPTNEKLVLTRQQQLSDAMARLSSAVATLSAATADPDNPDYSSAEEAMATITELMPLVVMDTKAIASSKDDKTRAAMLAELRALCAATREICEAHNDPQQLRKSAKKFGVASGKLVYVLNPRSKSNDANKVIKHANLVCNTARQLLKDCYKLADTLYATDVAADELRGAAAKTLDDVDALLTTTQLTAPSLRDPRCQAVLLSSLDALSQSAQHLAQQWAPIQAVDKQPLVKTLDAQHGELMQRLEDMRRECLGDYVVCPEKTKESKPETKEQKRVRFADTVSMTKSDLRDIEEELSKPYTGTPVKDQALAFRQLQLSNGLARLNAALAALAVATTDQHNPDYAAADEAISIIHETLPQVVKDTKAMAASRDEASGEVMLGSARALCFATAQICDQVDRDPKALRQFAKNFATASSKLIYGVNSRPKHTAAVQVMESTQAACKTANQLVKTSSRLTSQLASCDVSLDAPSDVVRRHIAESGDRTVDAADALMTAAQLTSPCISDPHCQSSFSTSIDTLSSSARELSSHWLPLLQEPLLTAVIKELEKESQQLSQELDHLKGFCQGSKKGEHNAEVEDMKIKEAQKTQYISKAAAAKKALITAEKELEKSVVGFPAKGEAASAQQLQLSQQLVKLHAALLALSIATSDNNNPDYVTAGESLDTISELTPRVLKNANTFLAGKENVTAENVADLHELLRAVQEICGCVEQQDSVKINDLLTKNAIPKLEKLYYVVHPKVGTDKLGKVEALTEHANAAASELLTGVHQLAAGAGAAGAGLQKPAADAADAARALLAAQQLTGPYIHEPEGQSTLISAADALSSSAHDLAAAWSPIIQEPQHKAAGEKLTKDLGELDDILENFRRACREPEPENIVHKSVRKPEPPPRNPSQSSLPKEVWVKQFNVALEIITALRTAEEDIKRVYDSSLDTPNMHRDQVVGVKKALEKKIALGNVAISSLLASYATEPMDHSAPAKSISDLATLVPKIAQDAKVLSNTMPEKQKKAFLDDVLAMFDATKKVTDTPHKNSSLNDAAVEYGNKSAALLYSVCTDFDPSQEKEVMSRAKAIGEWVSELIESSSALVSGSEVTDLCARGKACVTAAGNLLYTAKLVAPSLQIQECREILLTTSTALSDQLRAFSDSWQPLTADPKHKAVVEELDAKTKKVEGLLEELKKDLDSGKLVKMRPSQLLVVEDTPLRRLTSALIDSAMKKSSNSSLPEEQRRAYVEYGRSLATALEQLDLANAVCKKEPHSLDKRHELEASVQSLIVLALQSRPSLGHRQQQYIVDLTEYVKELSQEAERMASTAACCTTKHKEIDKSCQEITEEAERIMNPSNHQVRGDDTTVDDIYEVDKLARATDVRVKSIASHIDQLPDSKDKIQLDAQSLNLEDSCNILRFASQSAIATTQSASLDDTLQSLAELENKLDDLLAAAGKHSSYVNECSQAVPWPVQASLLAAAGSVSRRPALVAALAEYIQAHRTRTDLTDPDDKENLQSHLRKLTYLLRILTVETSRRVATWQEVDGPGIAAIMERVIKEIDFGCSLNQPNKDQSSVLRNIDMNQLLLSCDVIKIEGDRKDVEDKLHQTASKLSSTLPTVTSSSQPSSAARSLSVVANTARELAAVARALKRPDDPVYNAKIEDAVSDVTFQTYNVLKASELVCQEPNHPAHRRRLLEACRALNDALNNMCRTTALGRKSQRECSELARNLQFNQTLLQSAQPTCALPYAECLDALATQQEVIQKLSSDQPLSKQEFSAALSYVSAAVCNSAELASHCAYLMSLGEQDQEAAKLGVVDVRRLKAVTEAARACCYKLLRFDDEQAKEEAVHLISHSQAIVEALADAENKSPHIKEELRAAARALQGGVADLEVALQHRDVAKISSATTNLLDIIESVSELSDHPALVPVTGDLSRDQKIRQDHVLCAARELTNKTASLVRDVKNYEDRHPDDDEPMTWVTFNLKRKDVVKAFEDLLASVRENGQRAGILEVEHKQEEPPKSYIQIQVELANQWLKRPNCKPDVKISGEDAVRNVIELAEKMSADVKESEKEDLCDLITETKDLLSECSKKCTPEKASQLVERLKSLRKIIERSVVTMVVEDFIEGDEPMQDLDVLVDSEADAVKRSLILERKIAELLAQLARLSRTAQAVRGVTATSPADTAQLHTCTEQANLLAPLLVKAAQERINCPNNQTAVENYKSLLAQYAESLSKVRELCDRSVDPMEFVQTAGETMQRMREESHDNDPQKCVYTSSAITKLANRVIQVSMSSSNAKQDPELRKALSEAQQRLLAAVPGPQTRRSELPDWKDTTAEIMRTTGEVEAVMGGEMIFQNQPTQSDQPIFAAARDLHSAVREWSARDNEIVAVAKRTAVLMAKLSAHMNNAKHELLVTSQSLVRSARELADLARHLAMDCDDVRIKTNLLQVCDQIPTISGQLKMLTTVKGSSLSSGNKEDQESLNMLVDNAQNLMSSDISRELKKTFREEIQSLEASMEFVTDQLSTMEQSILKQSAVIKDLENKNQDLMNKNKNLELRVSVLEQGMNTFEQKSLSSCLEIAGLPIVPTKDVQGLVENIASKLDVNKDDVRSTSRLPGSKDKPGQILVEIRTPSARSQWIAAGKEKCLTVGTLMSHVSQEKAEDRVYIREALTKHIKMLLYTAKSQLSKSFKFVWCRDGKVCVRKTENSKIFYIQSIQDIDRIQKQSN